VNNKLTPKEREYLAWVKSQPCALCGASGPSDAHHIRQHRQYLCLPLCKGCHQGSYNGIHGQKRLWNVMKVDELDLLNEHIRLLASFANVKRLALVGM